MQKTLVQSLGWEDPLEKEMATPSSSLAWTVPWTEEPGGLYIVHGVSKSQTRLMEKTRNLKVQSKTNLESSEYNQVSQTRVWVRGRVCQDKLQNGLPAILAGHY